MSKIKNADIEINQLHSIADKLSRDLKKIGVNTVADLLWCFPRRYEDLSQIKKVSELQENEVATICVKVKNIKTYRSFRSKMIITEMIAGDDTDDIKAMWFRQKFVGQIIKPSDEIYISGKTQKKNSLWHFNSPSYEKVKQLKDDQIHSARLVPIYHLSGKITQKQIRFLISKALKDVPYVEDPLPVNILNKEKYPWLNDALQEIHFPSNQKSLKSASQRLKFQELFYLQCKYRLAKQDYQKQASYNIRPDKNILNQTVNNLPFKLTMDQQITLVDILADLQKSYPMNRLVEGDVGSGKTVIAMLAALATISDNFQTALMAPTEILASQHFISAKKIIDKKFHHQIALFTRTQMISGDGNKLTKKQISEQIKQGEIKLIIGTHSLIQEKIKYQNLAMAIIDEQHRFGVSQRQGLKNKNATKKVPHLLSMTATPIPRTLSLTLYGDLDISLIKEKPAGRQVIKTFLVPEKKRKDSYKFVREKIALGQQVFVICPLIDESDKLGVKSVKQEYEKLNTEVFPDLEIRQIHGKLKSEEKEKIMADFKENKFPILVATSVIEVGVDIPNATIMLIEGAERFGLSQLHQFRGRIGRNDLESFCLLFTSDESQLNKQRLQAMTKSSDGFELAELDLELRGSGEIFGTKQTGLMKLKIAKLSDTKLIKKAQDWAKEVTENKKYLSQKQLQVVLMELKTEMHLE